MTEVSFAKQFLTALDSRPIKLPSDHVTDPKTIPPDSTFILPRMSRPMRKRARTSKTNTDGGDGSDPSSSSGKDPSSVTVVLKSLRGAGAGTSSSTSNTPAQLPSSSPSPSSSSPPSSATVTLTNQGPDTSVFEIKVSYAQKIGIGDAAAAKKAAEKMKIFHARKLCTDSRTLVEIVGGEEKLQGEDGTQGGRTVELSVMMLGGLGTAKTGSAVDSSEGTVQKGSGAAVLQTEDFWVDLKRFLVERLKDEGEGTQTAEEFRKAWEASQK